LFRSIFLAAPEARYRARKARRSLSRRFAASRTIAALSALDDRTLKDIGISRSEIESFAIAGGSKAVTVANCTGTAAPRSGISRRNS
jgi:uncharacterized protein YjiS (DUF1127 family)